MGREHKSIFESNGLADYDFNATATRGGCALGREPFRRIILTASHVHACLVFYRFLQCSLNTYVRDKYLHKSPHP
jgi:hypothetical protein